MDSILHVPGSRETQPPVEPAPQIASTDPLSDLYHYLVYARSAERSKERFKQFVELAKVNTQTKITDELKRADFFALRLRPFAEAELEKQAGTSKTVKLPLGANLGFRKVAQPLVFHDEAEFVNHAQTISSESDNGNEVTVLEKLCDLGVITTKYSVSKTGLRAAIENKTLPLEVSALARIDDEDQPDSFNIKFDNQADFLDLVKASEIKPDDSYQVYADTAVGAALAG